MKIKQYKLEKIEVASKEFQLPTETCYFFETGVRRSIKLIPCWTTWNKEQYNKQEEIFEFVFICIYQSFECKVEKITIRVSELESIYYDTKHKHYMLVNSLIDGSFNKRTKEQFDADFNKVFSEIKVP